MHGLKIRLDESRQDVVLIELEGHLDSHTFEELETLFEELFQRDKHRLMVDLNKLRVNSSAGAGVFIGALGIYSSLSDPPPFSLSQSSEH